MLHETTARILAPFKYWHYVKTPSVRKYDTAVKELKRLIDRAVEARLAAHRYGPGLIVQRASCSALTRRPTAGRCGPCREAQRSGTAVPDALRIIEALTDFHLENPETVSRSDIVNQAVTFLFAGHDTTTNMIAWALYEAARRPDVWQRLQDEADAVLGDARCGVSAEHSGGTRCQRLTGRWHTWAMLVQRGLV